ncbi:hypothetical protein EVAR_103734_1 [Eumeta japonica]|uniref:Uncharacterized protein n=1 Tax=Eumeta variegata TaxID=151549 RepID=A0A4C1ZKP6_EUMVA|nr:hypothetical protein EVAR_103734_1 [Eumeta japonica]
MTKLIQQLSFSSSSYNYETASIEPEYPAKKLNSLSNEEERGKWKDVVRWLEGEWVTGTLSHWMNVNSRNCYFKPVFCESVVLHQSSQPLS